jgi:hypothetical protein
LILVRVLVLRKADITARFRLFPEMDSSRTSNLYSVGSSPTAPTKRRPAKQVKVQELRCGVDAPLTGFTQPNKPLNGSTSTSERVSRSQILRRMSSISTPARRRRSYCDHHRPRSEPANITAKRRSICTANTSGASAPLSNAMTATESIPPGVVAR